MIKYNEYDIYSKEVKLIIAEKKLTLVKVKDIFLLDINSIYQMT